MEMQARETCRWSVSVAVVCVVTLGQASVSKADDVNDLKAQVEAQKARTAELEKKVDDLTAAQKTKEQSPAKAETKPAAGSNDLRAYWNEGLKFETADKNFQLAVGGMIQDDWFWSGEDKELKARVGEQADGTEFRRVRLNVQGTVYQNAEYKLEVDFATGTTTLKDAYLGLTDLPIGKLRMGHFREPFSLDELTGDRFGTFIEKGLPNAFAPSRNAGFMLYNAVLQNRATWAVGVFKDTDDRGRIVDDGGYSETGRVTVLPIYENDGASLVHLGAAYSHRNPNNDVLRYSAQPEAHLANIFVDTRSFVADEAQLLGFEAACVNGPFSAQGECILANVNRLRGASDVDFSSYYVQGSYFLTGEHRVYQTSGGVFDRVRPKNNFGSGGMGAWEVAARYSDIDLNALSGGRLQDITAGLNWYLNPIMRVMWDYIHADKQDVGDADMLVMRLSVDF
jgi:phosphate-selective porin OprO/OprP